MKATIDGDVLCYALGSATNDHPFLKDELGKPRKIDMPDDYIRQLTEDRVNTIMQEAGCDTFEVHISGETNFRTSIAVSYPYKGNRSDKPKPDHHATVKAFLLSLPGTVVSDHREADDTLADAQTEDTVLCTVDKDLLMVPGLHYNWTKKEAGVITITYNEGIMWFLKQLLTGDWATDRILGCGIVENKIRKSTGLSYEQRKGIGDKKADSILGIRGLALTDHLMYVSSHYKSQFGRDWEDKINEMGQLLWMGGSENNLWTYEDFMDKLVEQETADDTTT